MKNLKLLPILIGLLSISLDGLGSMCRNYSPSVSDCQFYQCLEEKFSCGSEGYPLGYGYMYCDRFSKLNTPQNVHFAGLELSPKGVIWRDHTLVCLQDKLRSQLLNGGFNSCSQVQKIGFETHADCYTSGPVPVCSLPAADFITITSIVKSSDLIQIRSLRQVGEVLLKCKDQFFSEYNSIEQSLNSFEKDFWQTYNSDLTYLQPVSLIREISDEELELLHEKEELLLKLKALQSLENEGE